MPDNIYDLIMAADEPTAAQKAANMAALLRQEQTAGQLMQLHPLLRQMGSSMVQTSGQGMNRLAGAGDTRFAGRQRQQLQDDQQMFAGGEADKDRAARAREGVLNRALARERMKAAQQPQEPKPLDFGDRDMLRREFNGLPEVQSYKQVSTAFQKIQKAAQNPSAAGDLSMIFAYMKLLDPGSTVREGEFANAQNAAGVPTQIVNMYNRAREGTRLAPEQRADFLAQAKDLYGVHQGQYEGARKRYGGIAQRYAVDPLEIIGEDVALPTAAPAGPGGGAVASATPAATPPFQGAIRVRNPTTGQMGWWDGEGEQPGEIVR